MKTLNRLILFTIISLWSMCLQGCADYVSYGLPGKVEISREGGTKELLFEEPYFIIFDVTDFDGHTGDRVDNIDTEGYYGYQTEWLTVEHTEGSNAVILTVMPNTTRKKRTLYIHFYFGRDRWVTKVVQKK